MVCVVGFVADNDQQDSDLKSWACTMLHEQGQNTIRTHDISWSVSFRKTGGLIFDRFI